MTCFRSVQYEFLSLQWEIQDANAESYSGSGLCGCLLEYSGCSAAQDVPQVHLWCKGIPVQGSSLLFGFGSTDVHKVHGCCSGPVEAPGNPCA